MLEIRHITKKFGGQRVLDDLSLDIHSGEIFTLLGASGCGKTTLLRILAGLEQADHGALYFAGESWFDSAQKTLIPPQKRGIGLVFQSYAVWPHLSVFDNVAYPLRHRRVDRQTLNAKVLATLASVGLEDYAQRPAHQLSGGQQQRVAMARALVGDPKLLLLDEPFSNLDIQLRKQLRQELKTLQQRLGLTVVLVTHDQDDAFALSDRIAVLRAGRVEQIGTAEQIHDRPATAFVQGFVGRGSPLRGRLMGDRLHANVGGVQVRLGAVPDAPVDCALAVLVRPEHVLLDTTGAAAPNLHGRVSHSVFAGDRFETYVQLDDTQWLMAYQSRESLTPPGQSVGIRFTHHPHASALAHQE